MYTLVNIYMYVNTTTVVDIYQVNWRLLVPTGGPITDYKNHWSSHSKLVLWC